MHDAGISSIVRENCSLHDEISNLTTSLLAASDDGAAVSGPVNEFPNDVTEEEWTDMQTQLDLT